MSFWNRFMAARNRYYKELEMGGDYGLWLSFLETKQQLYRELGGVIPEVYNIPDFWRYVQDLKPEAMELAIKSLQK